MAARPPVTLPDHRVSQSPVRVGHTFRPRILTPDDAGALQTSVLAARHGSPSSACITTSVCLHRSASLELAERMRRRRLSAP